MKLRSSILLFFTAVLIASLSFSCKKDKSDSRKDQISYKGVDYQMDKAAAVHWNSKSLGNSFTLLFLSPGGQFITTGNVLDSLKGIGDAIALELYGPDSTTLTEGTYVYDTTGNFSTGTFDYVNMVLNKDLSQDINDIIEGYGGSVVVKKSGSDFEVTWTGADKNGNAISLYYNGIVNEYKESSKKQFTNTIKWW